MDPDQDLDQLELNPRITAAARRAKVTSARQALTVSGPDLQRITGLSRSDVQQLQTAAASACRAHTPVPALLLLRGSGPGLGSGPGRRLSLGCPALDGLLRGGLPAGGVTELAGPSGAGKSQLALQLCLSVQLPLLHGGLQSGAVYICTEASFPIRRLQQLISQQVELRADLPPALIRSIQFSDNIYIEHTADLEALQACVARRVPLLLARGAVRLLVVDSVAALFRSEFQAGDWPERTRRLLAFGAALHRLSHDFAAPVLCINQVTDVVDGSTAESLGLVDAKVSPALGLAWANQVMVRLMMRRLQGSVAAGDQRSAARRLEVVFAPHLERASCCCAVWREGVRGVTGHMIHDTHMTDT
uniref:DNA repair protein XRCC3 n=1 Tax=Centroberyx gerrardi TaxID=166262 RepID=UPI003AACDB35